MELDIEPSDKVSLLSLPQDHQLTDPQVSRIKERIEEKEGIPPVQQRIIFGGKQMYPIQSPLMMNANLCARVDDKSACTFQVDCD